MGSLLRLAALVLASFPCTALAQPPDAEARALELRAAARCDADAGRIEEAFAATREASGLTRDPLVFLELAELADRLRLDALALQAYETYLARRPDAPDRAAIAGRVRVLRLLLAGHRFDARAGEPLVDWEGRPVLVRRRDLVPLAEWDGTLRGEPGFGRRLSPP